MCFFLLIFHECNSIRTCERGHRWRHEQNVNVSRLFQVPTTTMNGKRGRERERASERDDWNDFQEIFKSAWFSTYSRIYAFCIPQYGSARKFSFASGGRLAFRMQHRASYMYACVSSSSLRRMLDTDFIISDPWRAVRYWFWLHAGNSINFQKSFRKGSQSYMFACVIRCWQNGLGILHLDGFQEIENLKSIVQFARHAFAVECRKMRKTIWDRLQRKLHTTWQY